MDGFYVSLSVLLMLILRKRDIDGPFRMYCGASFDKKNRKKNGSVRAPLESMPDFLDTLFYKDGSQDPIESAHTMSAQFG